MDLIIRQERKEDYKNVEQVIKAAFAPEAFSDHTEYILVSKLRKSVNFIPEFSIVAELDGKIVGHILLTRVKILNGDQVFESLAMAPVSILPEYQRRGIGGLLIQEAHRIAKEKGFTSINVLGHQDYYPKFGYKKASDYGIEFPFDAPDEACMILELVEDGLTGVKGTIQYPKEFFE